MLVSSRIQKRICIFNKISLFQWPETTHSAFEKKIFFWKFFRVFCPFTVVEFAQIQKNRYNLKTSKSCRFGIVTIVLIERFLAILLRFSKKIWLKKKNFFFEFLEIPFSDHNSARFDEKIFFENFKKKFKKKCFFFQMSNVSTCVVRHKLKLHEIKSPHVRNTWIAFLWPKYLYYCHTSQSKYKS